MVRLTVTDVTNQHDAWESALAGLRDLSLLQCRAYGDAKSASGPWTVERLLFIGEGGKVAGACQVMIRTLPLGLGGLAWVNRGPLWRPASAAEAGGGHTASLIAMLAALKSRYVDERGLYLRVQPNVADGALPASSLAKTGLEAAYAPGWVSARIDLGMPLEDLRRGLKQKWRNCLNKAERQEIEIRAAEDGDAMEDFLGGHANMEFAGTVTAEFLRALQAALPHGEKLTAVAAYQDNEYLGGALIARYGDTAEYLAGNTTSEGRRLNAGQLALWSAVEAAQGEGRRWFDLGGMDKALTPQGIYHFKEGLGGAEYQLTGEVEALPRGLTGGTLGAMVRWRVNRERMAIVTGVE